MAVRETVQHRIERRAAQPVDPIDLLSDGTMTIAAVVKLFGRSARTWKRAIDRGELPVCATTPLLVPRKAVVLYLADRLRFRKDLVVVPQPRARRKVSSSCRRAEDRVV